MTVLTRQARRVAHNAVLLRPDVGEVITVNDDFTDHRSDVRHWLRTRHPLGVCVQEGKRTDYRDALGPRWGVRQRMQDDSTRGVAVVWDRNRAEPAGKARNTPTLLGHGYRPLVVPRKGEDMLTRGIVWQDLELHEGGGVIRLASTHRPPFRHRHLWRTFDDRLEEWLALSPVPVVLGTDNNQAGGPDLDDEHWNWRGRGIDGFVSDLRVLSVYELALRHSDHRAVSGAFHLRGLPS